VYWCFRPESVLRVLLLFGILGFSIGTVLSIGKEEPWLVGIGAALVIAGCFVWPVTIMLDPVEIRSNVWFRPARVIPWNDVSGIERRTGGDIQVFGNHGQCVTFTRFHVDPGRFQDEVKQRARLNGVSNASAPPCLRA